MLFRSLIKLAMISVDDWCQQQEGRARLIMQVHDELVLEVRADVVDAVRDQVRQRMIAAAGDALRVPLKVDVGVGTNWDEAH